MKLKVWNLCLKMKFKWETEIQNRNLDSIEFCQNLKNRFAILHFKCKSKTQSLM